MSNKITRKPAIEITEPRQTVEQDGTGTKSILIALDGTDESALAVKPVPI